MHGSSLPLYMAILGSSVLVTSWLPGHQAVRPSWSPGSLGYHIQHGGVYIVRPRLVCLCEDEICQLTSGSWNSVSLHRLQVVSGDICVSRDDLEVGRDGFGVVSEYSSPRSVSPRSSLCLT